jgi:hypothetical protein
VNYGPEQQKGTHEVTLMTVAFGPGVPGYPSSSENGRHLPAHGSFISWCAAVLIRVVPRVKSSRPFVDKKAFYFAKKGA